MITPREAAIEFLKYYLDSFNGDLQVICSDARIAGPYGRYGCQLGNLYTTTPDRPAKAITVYTVHGKEEKYRFQVEEIYQEIIRHGKKPKQAQDL